MKKTAVVSIALVLIGFVLGLVIGLFFISQKDILNGEKNDTHDAVTAVNSYSNSESGIEFHFPDESEFDSNMTSFVAKADQPTDLEVTVYSPLDPGDARIEIKNTATGTSCTSDNYLVTKLILSKDQSTMIVFNYSGSSQYIDFIDTATCKEITKSIVISRA